MIHPLLLGSSAGLFRSPIHRMHMIQTGHLPAPVPVWGPVARVEGAAVATEYMNLFELFLYLYLEVQSPAIRTKGAGWLAGRLHGHSHDRVTDVLQRILGDLGGSEWYLREETRTCAYRMGSSTAQLHSPALRRGSCSGSS